MDARAILVSAILVGGVAGFAWSAIGAPEPPAPRTESAIIALPASPEELPAEPDKEWSARADGSASTTETAANNGTSSAVYYSGCNEVRAAGKAPLHSGEPGYRPEMDGDGDGVACEPHRRG